MLRGEGLGIELLDACGHNLDRDTPEESKHVLGHTALLCPQFERTDAVLERVHRRHEIADGVGDTYTINRGDTVSIVAHVLQVPVSSHVKVLGQLREALEPCYGQTELNVIHLKLNDGHARLLDLDEILNVRALRHGDVENSKHVGAQHILRHHHYRIHICTGQMHVEAIGTERLEPERCRIIVLVAAAVLLKGLPDKLGKI